MMRYLSPLGKPEAPRTERPNEAEGARIVHRRALLRSAPLLLAAPLLGRADCVLRGSAGPAAAFVTQPPLCRDLFDYENDRLGQIVWRTRRTGLHLRDLREVAQEFAFVGTHFEETGFDGAVKAATLASALQQRSRFRPGEVLSAVQRYDPLVVERDLFHPEALEASNWKVAWDDFGSNGISPLLLNAAAALNQRIRAFDQLRATGRFSLASFEETRPSGFGSGRTAWIPNGFRPVSLSAPLIPAGFKRVLPAAMAIVSLSGNAISLTDSTITTINTFLALARLVFTRTRPADRDALYA